MMDPADLPLVAALATAADRDHAAFYAPGHKRGQGISETLEMLLGLQVFRADLPELPELDNLFAPTGPIAQAQQLAALAFGAEDTFFLANGSTCGIEAAVLATCAPGEKILVPRNAHRSVLAALILSGARPIFLAPNYDAQWDLAYGVTPAQVAGAFAQHSDIRAVLLVSPTYQGICTAVSAIAAIVHGQGAVLIVDEAHGPHLSFHPELPPGAIAGGADLVIQSTHKVLSALTQASMLHVQGTRVDRDRLRQALQLTQSTSPSYLLLASLDAARQQMATQGQALMDQVLTLAQGVRSRLTGLAPLRWLAPEQIALMPGGFQLDLTRLTVDVSALGLSGFDADDILHRELGVTAELPTLRQLTFILSLGNTAVDADRLVAALATLVSQTSPSAALPDQRSSTQPWEIAALAEPPFTPREAFFAPSRTVAIADAAGAISADTLCPYPPGIPLLLPGEVITAGAIAQLQQIQAAGGMITGSSDPDLQTLRIVASAQQW